MIEKKIEKAREMFRVFECMIKGKKACVLERLENGFSLSFSLDTVFTCFCLAVNWVFEILQGALLPEM